MTTVLLLESRCSVSSVLKPVVISSNELVNSLEVIAFDVNKRVERGELVRGRVVCLNEVTDFVDTG